jgi:lysophospholipase L1-like esterase
VTHSVEEYSANLEKLVVRMKKTGSRLIFATTTPVPEGEAGRKVGDDILYNKAALTVMRKHKVSINDLHSLMVNRMSQFGIRPANVHFTPKGSVLLAEKVAKALREALLAERE